jgi:hypothetical protein
MVLCALSVACADAELPAGPRRFEARRLEGYVDPLSAPETPTLSARDFSGAALCGSCHPQHYEEWRHSAHANSMNDPVFQALVARQREDLGIEEDRFCTQCHSAIGTRSGDIEPGFELSMLSALSREGVTCENCHRATGLERSYNSGHLIDPAAPLQGPFADAAAPHASAQSGLLRTSAFCGGCHDVLDPTGLVLESPLAEWQMSPAAAQGKPCQTCHMPTYRGTAAATPDAPAREVHRHWFTGVEVPLGLDPDDARDEVALRARSEALLASSVGLALAVSRAARGELRIETSVQNRIDGHDFPTGSAFFRQFWLAVEVVDAAGRTLHATGTLDPAGELSDEGATFGATLIDEVGQRTLFPWRARSVKKHVLEPLAREAVMQRVRIAADVSFPLTVRARLRFRAFAPRLLRALGLDALLPRLTIVDIAEATARVD